MSEPEKNPKAAGFAGRCKAASIATAAPGSGDRNPQEDLANRGTWQVTADATAGCRGGVDGVAHEMPSELPLCPLHRTLGMDALGNALWMTMDPLVVENKR